MRIALLFVLAAAGIEILSRAETVPTDAVVLARTDASTATTPAPVVLRGRGVEAETEPGQDDTEEGETLAARYQRRWEQTEFENHEEDALISGWPADPLPRGTCRLVLEFLHAHTGEPAVTGYELWHLDAPASSNWSAGARMRAMAECDTAETYVVDGLPPGRYRVRVRDVAPTETDPPAFDVSGDETIVPLRILPPRPFRVRVHVCDEEGRTIRRGAHCVGLCCGGEVTTASPPWASPRRVLADGRVNDYESCSHWDGEGAGEYEPIEADTDGFLTNDGWNESPRGQSAEFSVIYRFEGRTEVGISVDQEGIEDRCFAAVSVPMSWVRERMRHADGGDLTAADDLEVRARAFATRLPDGRPDEDAWRGMDLRVWVLRDGKEIGRGKLCPGDPGRLLFLPASTD